MFLELSFWFLMNDYDKHEVALMQFDMDMARAGAMGPCSAFRSEPNREIEGFFEGWKGKLRLPVG